MHLTQQAPAEPGVAEWPVWTTTARVVTTDPSVVAAARRLVEAQLAAVDQAASRFRPDSELMRLAASPGRPTEVSPLLAELVSVALRAAAETDGALDPTLGSQLSMLGYDRYIAQVGAAGDAQPPVSGVSIHPRHGWRDIRLDGHRLTVSRGVVLDLGATAKAWAADHCAAAVVRELGGGALVGLGGDVAVAGTDPAQCWTILVQDGYDEPASLVTLGTARGLATSSTLRRSWQRDGRRMHHILDPRTALPAPTVWRSVSVAAETCLEANIHSTATVVRGSQGLALLRQRGLPCRLVRDDGSVVALNGWPA